MSSRRMPGRKAFMAAAFLGLVVSGCANAPSVEIAAADEAMNAAVSAGAEEYAPQSLAHARDLKAQLESELSLQAEKWAVTRNYDHALELTNQLKTAGEQATSEATSAKEAARQETSVLLAEVKVALEEVQTLLANAPTGKGTAVDLAALKADLDQAVVTLGESEAAFSQGRYLEAKTKVMAVKSGTESVKAAIDAAVQARSARRGPGS